MKTFIQPNRNDWVTLLERPQLEQKSLESLILDIFKKVRANGDQALIDFAEKFDNSKLDAILVKPEEIEEASNSLDPKLKEAIELAKGNIEKFHRNQELKEETIETQAGVKCWRKALPIEKVGLYIPGGSAPLFSTILMLGIPAKLAGCEEIVLCTPPVKEGSINPAILYSAQLVGCTKIMKVGGAQAIGAMTFGTESVPKVDKIFGPGNQYVTKAKEMVQKFGVAIDMPAGPSEVLVIADETSVPEFVAADLLSQAEHGSDSQVILLSDQQKVIEKCMLEVDKQVGLLPRKETALKALENSKAIALSSIKECFEFSNAYAPEHLILATENAENYLDLIKSAGSVFVGNYSCESAGDYASGTNHTLPTNGYARNYSGVSLDSFSKRITFQKLDERGIKNLGPAIEIMAEAEELIAHKNAVSIRLNYLKNV